MNFLFVVPHADDEVLLGGGTISKLIRQNNNVDLIVCMSSETEREEYQLKCCLKVVDYLKINSVKFLNISSTDLSNNLILVARTIEKEISNSIKKYEALYTVSEFDNHQDHRCVHNAVNIAARSSGPNNIPLILAGETMSSTDQRFKNNGCFNPNYYNILSRDDVHKKLQAMAMYDRELRDPPHPRSLGIIENFAKIRGSEVMRDFAEAFICMRNIVDK